MAKKPKICAVEGCTQKARNGQKGWTHYCRDHSLRVQYTISRSAERKPRYRRPDADSTWKGRRLSRDTSAEIRGRLRAQLEEMAVRWRSNLGEPTNAA
jgi:hypothetical protein